MSQTNISNGMSLMTMLYTCSLQPVPIYSSCSEYEWIRVHSLISVLLNHLYSFLISGTYLRISGEGFKKKWKNWDYASEFWFEIATELFCIN